MGYRFLDRGLYRLVACGAILFALTACGINDPRPATMIVTLPPEPTITFPPVITATQRLTATPIPTNTFIPTATFPPSETPVPPTPTSAVTPTPLAAVQGTVDETANTVNLRAGPGENFRALTRIPGGTTVLVLGLSDDRIWYFVVADLGVEGWMKTEFVAVDDRGGVPVVPSIALTQRADAGAQVATVVAASGPTPIPTIPYRRTARTDILAYCDLAEYKDEYGNRAFGKDAELTIFWSWFARTRAQTQSHVDYGRYEVTLDKKNGEAWQPVRALDTWTQYRTSLTTINSQSAVFWYVPIGKLESGEYRVNYKLTWTQQVDDGAKTYGPGGAEEINTGTCLFKVN